MKNVKKTTIVLLVALLATTIPLSASAQPIPSAQLNPIAALGDLLWSGVGPIPGVGDILGSAGDIAGAIANAIGNILINLIFQVPLAITATFWLLTAILVKWVLSPDFIGIPITSSDNTVVYEMWRMVRDFANMGFVLALIAIALGTALRYGEYQLQKALPRLIIIALLINFTPVIVGFFIDAANIIISFLVSETAGENLLQLAKMAYSVNINLLTSILNNNALENLAAATAQLIFNVIATIVYLLFFSLFFFRYVALIILFILSPLAFFAFILPATREFWDMWWKHFTSWLIVGITGAFFILLASQMIGAMWNMNVDVGSGPFKVFQDFITIFIVALTPIAFLIIGFMYTLQTSAMGAQKIIKASQAAGGVARDRGWQWGKATVKNIRQEAERIQQTYQIQRVAFGDTRMGAVRTALGGTWARVRTATTSPATYGAAMRGIGRAIRDTGETGLREALGWKKAAKKERPTCPKCGNYVPQGASHCPHCGLAMPTCPNCGKRTVPGAKFCQFCGTPLP